MFHKVDALLIFTSEHADSMGILRVVEQTKRVAASDIGTFSRAYYENGDRDMRASANLRIRTEHTKDYEGSKLRFVEYQGKRFQVVNVLNDKESRSYSILDIQEDC